MDGRRPVGIMYVNTHVADSGAEVEYDRWYRDVHFPDVTEPGIFVNATMFHNANAPPGEGEGRFLAFYECFWPDLEAASEAFAKTVRVLFAEHRVHAGTVNALFGIYRRHGIHFGTERRRRSQSVLAVHVDCAGESGAADLVRWYTEEHVPEVVGLGLYHTGSFHELVRSPAFADALRPDQPRFLALYESDIGDPRFLTGEVAKRFPPDRLPTGARIRLVSNFYRAGP